MITPLNPKNTSIWIEIYQIVKDNYGSEESARRYLNELNVKNQSNQPEVLIETVDDKVVSVGAYMEVAPFHRVFRLCWINVHKDYRGQGFGRKMILARLKAIAKLVERRGEEDFTVILFCREAQRKFNEDFGFDMWSMRSERTLVMGQHLNVRDALGAIIL